MHGSENMVNQATGTSVKTVHDTIEWLVVMSLAFLDAFLAPVMGERDFRKAFRGYPICPEHLIVGIIVMMHQSRQWAVQFRGMCFGAIAAVFAFHGVGAMIAAVVRRYWKAPMARYMDDFSQQAAMTSGGRQ